MLNKGSQKQAVPETVKGLEAIKRAISPFNYVSIICLSWMLELKIRKGQTSPLSYNVKLGV